MLLRLLASSSLMLATVSAAQTPAAPAPADPKPTKAQDRICETIVLTGSRIGARKFCGTRAEWEDRRQQDKDTVNNIQTRINGPCSTVNQHSGTPAC